VNQPEQLGTVLETLERVQQEFNAAQSGGKAISLADLIVLAGSAAVERAAREGGVDVTVPFHAGRTDASQEQTDVESFSVLEPRADGFRNYLQPGEKLQPETLLVERAYMLGLSAPEMTVLVGGLRALGASHGESPHGVLTDRPGVLTADVLVNLLKPGTTWKASSAEENVFERTDGSGETVATATAVDLVIGANSQLRAIAEVYASDDAGEKFVHDFVAAWVKVMELDRFDLH
jgi:catalase-peroxidase